MSSAQTLSSVIDLVNYEPNPLNDKNAWWGQTSADAPPPLSTSSPPPEVVESPVDDPELKLPDLTSMMLVIGGNTLLQITFYIVVSSASAYAKHLGGTATFSGLIIGIPSSFAGLALIPMVKFDGGRYKLPINIGYVAMILGNILYGLAYRANFLYLILIGRIVSGFGFTALLYCKRYCADPRIVGVRRRTTLASWLVVGQGIGFSAGPFIGGLLFKIGFPNAIFNGYTSPGWLVAVAWVFFLAASILLFKDVRVPPKIDLPLTPLSHPSTVTGSPALLDASQSDEIHEEDNHPVSLRQWGVIITMMWYAMTCFFILGAWESNIPVFTAERFNYNPYNAGNFIALGGITTFPFLILNVFYSGRFQDRAILAFGSSLGTSGVIIMIAVLVTNRVTFGSFFVCWFLVALGFNLASTCTLSLLSKQLPPTWNGRLSLAIQYSNYAGRVSGAVWGGAGVNIGMVNYLGLQVGIVGVAGLMHLTLWRELKAKMG
ncbi:MFS general substrate transporter [Collybia nuda]|uniref:MFS general substrate transporter n=1 Tax=Collybia nuda TaxID=64659 RepID=A0A9P5XWS4_9AGAR|nr:MFS general substrate transporter [Collybia nuda]